MCCANLELMSLNQHSSMLSSTVIHNESFKRRARQDITLLGTKDSGGKAACQLFLRQQL